MDAVQACGCCMIALDDVAIPDGKDSREQLQGYLDQSGLCKGHCGAGGAGGAGGVTMLLDQPHETELESLNTIDLGKPSNAAVMAPFEYIKSLPSKGVRDKLIDALNVWMQVSLEDLAIIKSVVADVHNLSLMLDDIEDGSPLRRSRPATHTVFGIPQTVNSATYQLVDIIGRVRDVGSGELVHIVLDGLRSLMVGQSLDLFWTHDVSEPLLLEYVQMVDAKTGSLFRMIVRMLAACSPIILSDLDVVHRLVILFGRYFQIRDDYANVVSSEYVKTKGFCEDLDEGKYSYIVIKAMEKTDDKTRRILRSLLIQRRESGAAVPGQKELMLAIFEESGAMRHTSKMLSMLWDQMQVEIRVLESRTKRKNLLLTQIIQSLSPPGDSGYWNV